MSTVTSPIILDSTGQRMATALESIATAQSSVTLTITMKGTNNVQASGEQVIIKSTTTGAVIHSLNYNGVPVTVKLARDTYYTITGTVNTIQTSGFYFPSTAQGIAQADTVITITYQVISSLTNLLAIQSVVQANPGVEVLPIGTTVTIPYVCQDGVERNWTWAIVYYGYFVKESDAATGTKTWGCIMWATQCTDVNIQFDAQERVEATEEYAVAGMTYFGKTGNTITKLTLSTGDAVPYSQYDAVYHNEINNANNDMTNYGYNNWAHSAQRQWINSDAGTGDWWTAQHIGDAPPYELNYTKGMLYGFRDVDKAALTKVAIHTVANTSTDGGTEYVTYDKMFLPSVDEMYGIPDNQQLNHEGAVWKRYWEGIVGIIKNNDSQNLRKIYSLKETTSAQCCRVRSASRGNSYYAWYVTTGGQLYTSDYAYNSYRAAPACVIC